MNNIEKVFKLFEIHREQFENMMNAGERNIAYAHIVACQALHAAGEIFEPDAVEVEQMSAAWHAMLNWPFGKE